MGINADAIYINVSHCARCGSDHRNLEFRQFNNPVLSEDGIRYEYWGTCPNTVEPILLRIAEELPYDD